jgi:multidrug efflux pump subunit AcrA (membrane-fusion protein)
MFVSAEVALPATATSLVVPADSVQTVAGISHVFVIQHDKAEQRMITPGVSVGALTEVLKGLTAGELVAVGGATSLTDAGRVRIDGRPVVPAPPSGRVPAKQ